MFTLDYIMAFRLSVFLLSFYHNLYDIFSKFVRRENFELCLFVVEVVRLLLFILCSYNIYIYI